ncbi:MAG: hypothetical protein SPI94_05115 [Candidatus Onthovivens sp.]|nr:hypothetical protein [Clostridium sp.]MDY5984831.1 hypothetical protein [Candidatus Onthovivens sp.]
MADRNQEGLNNIIAAINNIVEPKISNSKFDRTFRAKVIEKTENEDYIVQINNINYTLKYAGKLEPNQIVRVKAPLNNFSDIYIESLPGSGGGSGSTDNYNDLVNKPILETDISENLVPDKDELIKGTIKLHKISKTGDYGDLNNKPELNFVPETEKASANGVATLGSDKKVITEQLPIASTSKLGVIKAGENVVIAEDGTLSAIGGSGGTVIDNLTSTSSTNALSANMGRILDTKVSISEAPPETSNVAKLWVDTSPILTGGNPDLLYNGNESEDWNSLLTPLKNKIFEAYFSSSTYTDSAILGYGDTVIDTTGGRVTAGSNGLIKINYDGNVRIKAQFWVKADSNARPWTRLEDYDNNRVTLISSIDDMPSGYLTVTIEKIVPNSGVHNYDISVGLSTGGMTINGDSGSDVNSILIVELL